MNATEITEILHFVSHNILTVILLMVVGAQVRLFYVITVRKCNIPPLLRIIISHILLSHMGISIFGLIHFAVDKIMKVNLDYDTLNKARPNMQTHKHCDALAIIEHVFWIADCMLNTLHAFIRFNSICRPFYYKKNCTDALLMKQAALIWAVSAVLPTIALRGAQQYYTAMRALGMVFSIVTITLYLTTLAYWKFIKDDYRRSIPATVLRTTVAAFALCSADILSTFMTLYLYTSKREAILYILSMNLWIEIVQVTSQVKEIIFPILLFVLFGKASFWRFAVKTISDSGAASLSRSAFIEFLVETGRETSVEWIRTTLC